MSETALIPVAKKSSIRRRKSSEEKSEATKEANRRKRLHQRQRVAMATENAGANNSMPMADKAYDAPEPPEDIDSYMPGLAEPARIYRECAIRPEERNYITMYFRVRRLHYEQLLWQYISTGIFTKDSIYMPHSLPYWTLSMRLKLRTNFPLGRVLETMKSRLGITSPGLKFCLDGFFGMVNYADIFRNTTDSCPWMEVSNFSTVESLRLRDSDSIFISLASPAQVDTVMKWRKRHFTDVARSPAASTSSSSKETRFNSIPELEFKRLAV